jgi:hypothetical protein
MRVQSLDGLFGDALEEPSEAQVRDASIMEKRRTMVAKSIDRSASSGPTMRKAIMRTAPMIAAPGRSIFIQGNFPSAKTK